MLVRSLLFACLFSGCFSVRYVAQATSGEASLLLNSQPISAVLRNPKTPKHVRRLLHWVPDLKEFATAHGLTATQNYTRYTQLDRTAAVWVVQACASLKFESHRWSFPVVGSVPYLGFFDEASARAYAAELTRSDETLDVDVRPASAYSTLGWFRDPVLSTMLGDGDEAIGGLANVVLHESTHATVYVNGQSAFDESLASFVGDHLTQDWLSQRFGPGSAETFAWRESERRFTQRVARLQQAYEALEAIYTSTHSPDEKRAQKRELLEALRVELGVRRPLNNATLVGFRIYDSGGDAFERLFRACGADWSRFFAAIRTLSAADFPALQTESISSVTDALSARVTASPK